MLIDLQDDRELFYKDQSVSFVCSVYFLRLNRGKPSDVSCSYVDAAHLSLKPPVHTPRGTIGLMFCLKSGSSPLSSCHTDNF